MPRFNIFNQASGRDLGTYEAADSDAAVNLMAQDAGYQDAADMRARAGNDPDLIVSQVGLNAEPLRRGDFVTIKPEFQGPEDGDRNWLVCSDEAGGQLRITPLGTDMALPPIRSVYRAHLEPAKPRREDMAAAFFALRKSAGMTQTEVANYLGVALRTVQGWEKGEFRTNPSAYRLLARGMVGNAAR